MEFRRTNVGSWTSSHSHQRMEVDPELGTPEGDRLDILATLLQAYEQRHFPMDLPDAVEAIKFRMDQQGLHLA